MNNTQKLYNIQLGLSQKGDTIVILPVIYYLTYKQTDFKILSG